MPDCPQVTHGRHQPMAKQQMTSQRAQGAMEQAGIADVEEDGVQQAPGPGLAVHDVTGLPATDQHVVMRRERLRVVAVQLELRPGKRAFDDVGRAADPRPAGQRGPRQVGNKGHRHVKRAELEPGVDGPGVVHRGKGGEVVAILGQHGREQPDAVEPVGGQDVPRPQVAEPFSMPGQQALRVESQQYPDDALPVPEHESVIRRIHLPRRDAGAGPGNPGIHVGE